MAANVCFSSDFTGLIRYYLLAHACFTFRTSVLLTGRVTSATDISSLLSNSVLINKVSSLYLLLSYMEILRNRMQHYM